MLYFLRAFESYGALVRMIFRVLALSIPFLSILLIVSGSGVVPSLGALLLQLRAPARPL